MAVLSTHDEVVPPAMGRGLFELACRARVGVPGLRREVVVRGVLHKDAWMLRQWVLEMK